MRDQAKKGEPRAPSGDNVVDHDLAKVDDLVAEEGGASAGPAGEVVEV